MTQTLPATETVAARHASRRRRPRIVLGALAAVIVLGAFVAWLATGLLSASRTVQADAAEAQGQLQQFRDTLKLGDQDAARKHLAAGKTALRRAQAAARRERSGWPAPCGGSARRSPTSTTCWPPPAS